MIKIFIESIKIKMYNKYQIKNLIYNFIIITKYCNQMNKLLTIQNKSLIILIRIYYIQILKIIYQILVLIHKLFKVKYKY